MAIDFQEEEFTFLQNKESVNKKQLGERSHMHAQAEA